MNKDDKRMHDVERRRDEAIRRALNTPPVENKDLKKGKKKPAKKKASSKGD